MLSSHHSPLSLSKIEHSLPVRENDDCFGSAFGFVDLNPLGVFRPWPLCVTSESGKCFLTASTVNPGHAGNLLFLIAARKVGFVGNPATAW